MSDSRTFAAIAVMVHAVTARTAALLMSALLAAGLSAAAALTAAPAHAAPYPPGSPCVVSARRTGPVAADGSAAFSVTGVGLGPSQAVRLVLASRQLVGQTRTDAAGGFTASVRAPQLAAAQPIIAASAQKTCSSSVGAAPTTAPTAAPTTSATAAPTVTGGPTGSSTAPPSSTPRAEPGGLHAISAYLGVIIAAVLLVLGTLAVLLFTRRPEH